MRSPLTLSARQVDAMAAARKVVELPIGETELAELRTIARSRTEPASHVARARMLLHYRDDPSCHAAGRAVGVTHQTVQRCLARAIRFGVMAALDDSPRPGKEPEITLPSKGVAGVSGMPEGQGRGIPTRTLDDAVAGPS
jgi:hypothetical protein